MNSKIASVAAFSDCLANIGKARIIAAGPLSLQPLSVAYRWVLVERENNHTPFVVWYQTYPKFPDLSESHFHEGHYFMKDQIDQAVETFAEKIRREAKTYLSVISEAA